MTWVNNFIEWRAEMGAFRFVINIIFLIPTLFIFHYLMFYASTSYKNAKKVQDWLPISLVLVAMIIITLSYS